MAGNARPASFDRGSRFCVETGFHVRYAETDNMGIVHHAVYPVYFEEGRSQYMRDMGSDYALVEQSGYLLPVTEVQVCFSGSLRYGQQARVRTWIAESRSRSVVFAYEISADDNPEILVTGLTRHVWTDREGKVTRLPQRWHRHFQPRSR